MDFIKLHPKAKDVTNQRFVRLVALGPVGVKAKYTQWLCRCDCGQQKTASIQHLISGVSKSCGCYKRDRAREFTANRNTTHGMSKTNTYAIWCDMIKRCTVPTTKVYPYYGGRGVTVCERWRKFENFYADMGERPSAKFSLDRYPNKDGNYEPSNVRWATDVEQGRNKRSNRIVKAFGREEPLVNFIGMEDRKRYFCVLARLNNGWAPERALTEPTKPHHGGQ